MSTFVIPELPYKATYKLLTREEWDKKHPPSAMKAIDDMLYYKLCHQVLDEKGLVAGESDSEEHAWICAKYCHEFAKRIERRESDDLAAKDVDKLLEKDYGPGTARFTTESALASYALFMRERKDAS